MTKDTDTYFAKALDYAERSKSIILLEAVKQSGAKTIAGIPTDLLNREQFLKKKIELLEKENYSLRKSLVAIQKNLALSKSKKLNS